MAKILGQSGRYVADEAAKQKQRILIVAIVVIAAAGAAEGVVIASYLPPIPFNSVLRGVIFTLILLLLILSHKWAENKISGLERKQKNYQSGAQGENIVGKELTRFPNDYYVINDFKTDYGNLDHVVIGPTGVFAIDAKNWRGIVSADGKGELLLNEKPTDKQEIKSFTRRMMDIKERVEILTRTDGAYFQALFAFTSAKVEANWGKTGSVHCLRDDQLYNYIVEKDFGTRLKPEQVKAIARAFAQLAHMEIDFTEKAKL